MLYAHHRQVHISLPPKGMHQRGGFDLQGLSPCIPLPSTGCLPLFVALGSKPQTSAALQASPHLLVSKELANVEHSGCRQAHSFLPNLNVPSPCGHQAFSQGLGGTSTPDVSWASRSCHRTSSCLIPSAATSNHCLALLLASISTDVLGPSLLMSMWAMNCHAGLPPEASILYAAGSPWPPSSHLTTQCMGVYGV